MSLNGKWSTPSSVTGAWLAFRFKVKKGEIVSVPCELYNPKQDLV